MERIAAAVKALPACYCYSFCALLYLTVFSVLTIAHCFTILYCFAIIRCVLYWLCVVVALPTAVKALHAAARHVSCSSLFKRRKAYPVSTHDFLTDALPEIFERCSSFLTDVSFLTKRVLEYGVRAPVFYWNLREHTGGNGVPRKPTGNMFCSYRNLRKPPGVYGIM